MKINPEDYLTIEEVGVKLGTNERGACRVLRRALDDGFQPRERLFGRTLIHRKHLPALEKYFFPRGTERAAAMAKASGGRGGATKAANARLREEFLAAVAASEHRDESGTSDTEAAAPRSRSPRLARRGA